MDEYKFLETEEKILDGQPPLNVGKWKKETSDKMGSLDIPYEQECVKFLDYFIQKKNV